MKVELIKQIFGSNITYKIKEMNWCCDKLKENPIIDLFDEYTDETGDIPSVMINESEIINSYEDELEQDYYYPIKYCPFCGEKINISVVDEEDVTDIYAKLVNQRKKLWKKCQTTDSKNETAKLGRMVRDLDSKINWFHELVDYDEKYLIS